MSERFLLTPSTILENGRSRRYAKRRPNQTLTNWRGLASTLYVPHIEEEYDSLVGLLDNLVDEVGENESHPLASLMEIVGVLIEK